MGLNDTYDHVSNQILVMHHLPSIDKAYSMTSRAEKQRESHVPFEIFENSAMLARSENLRSNGGGKRNIKKKLTKRAWIVIATIMVLLGM